MKKKTINVFGRCTLDAQWIEGPYMTRTLFVSGVKKAYFFGDPLTAYCNYMARLHNVPEYETTDYLQIIGIDVDY